MNGLYTSDTIVALATATGAGAIGVIRLSGNEAIAIADTIFKAHHTKPLAEVATHTVHLGMIEAEGHQIDECLATVFKGQRSYTGEPVVEFSCHGSSYIIAQVMKSCLAKGARLAEAGEFTKRAFLNGKMALSQAEAVADLIASDSEASHRVALQQMRGGFASEIETLRGELLNFASLIELELDFAEEDVAFADRDSFKSLLSHIKQTIIQLVASFSVGNVLKNGMPVAIVGKPNAGKSTLLNALLNEERAIVSDIAGTTRDTIEEVLHIGGIAFRFIDTAGIRETHDAIEAIGVQRAKEKIAKAQIVIFLYNQHDDTVADVVTFVKEHYREGMFFMLVHNKIDLYTEGVDTFDEQVRHALVGYNITLLTLSAKERVYLEELKQSLTNYAQQINKAAAGNTVVTNLRHYQALQQALAAVERVEEGLASGLSADLLAIDIRETLYYLGSITGAVSNDEVLGNIFSKFCIGK
ncbi:tRNA uridine-5-carboxymethylaminomethyl(34) synthesis GTPase MnmE [Capnocytophaga leadbetteri]|uniref:tRNA uridine-5-carboxymethylaminomethyl(34) synthesis GTPase MnmE n=1 Tax=Capnocytophaga leadbetteri TaxID=327575 RepID=UPI0026F2A14D|nr:tRNA uridine-5-carboxymethylaminomethyl(34) synthesis GTPase MnmE [Capnocytophaga leadbetteri]